MTEDDSKFYPHLDEHPKSLHYTLNTSRMSTAETGDFQEESQELTNWLERTKIIVSAKNHPNALNKPVLGPLRPY